MKRGVRNKTAEKRLKMVIFKLLVLSYIYAHYPIFFILFFKNMNKFYRCCVKIQEKV